MRIEVLLSSGELDGWNAVSDATVENGQLHILQEIVPSPDSPTDEQLAGMKVVMTKEYVDQGPDLPPGERVRPHLLLATYAPGMWMKVAYIA